MLSRYRNIEEESLIILRPEERPWGFLVHVLGWIPVWGFVINSAIWLYFRNRSRELVFHIQQAIQFHIVVLIPMLAYVISYILIGIVGKLMPGVEDVLDRINNFLIILALTLAGVQAVYGSIRVYMGKQFLYPVIGRKVLEGSVRKFVEE